MKSEAKFSYELRLAYCAILCFITAQYVVNERPFKQIFRMVGLLAFMGSLLMAGRKHSLRA
jgi:hypothetical protein